MEQYNEGAAAAILGADINDNPYDLDTEEWFSWEQGFNDNK